MSNPATIRIRRALRPWLLGWLAVGATLALPPPGETSRERTFCRRWLELGTAEKHDVVEAAEALVEEDGELPDPLRACRRGLSAGLRRKLDAECRNWPELMEFEVRMIVDGVYGVCTRREPKVPEEKRRRASTYRRPTRPARALRLG